MTKPPGPSPQHSSSLPWRQDSHLPDEVLVLAVDGELSPKESAQVAKHLEACWSCRVRREQIETVITGVVEYSNVALSTAPPLSGSGRAELLGRLSRAARGRIRASLWRRLARRIIYSSPVPGWRGWTGAMALLCVLLLLLAEFYQPSLVSADTIILHSEASERRLLQSVAKPVVYQKLDIEGAGQTLTRVIYRDPLRNRRVEVDSSGPVGVAARFGNTSPSPVERQATRTLSASLQSSFERAGLDWDDPLSPAAFWSWLGRFGDRAVSVTAARPDSLSIRVEIGQGPVRNAVFTVRSADYHPIRERFVLHNADMLEVTELAYDVFSRDSINGGIFDSLAPPPQPIRPALVRKPPVLPAAPGLSPSEQAYVELRAWLALHTVGADIGEQIRVEPAEGGSVLVRGVVDSPAREQEIVSALRGIPNLDTRLSTVQQLLAQQPAANSPSGPKAFLVEGDPLLKSVLAEQFPQLDDRNRFVNSALGAAQLAMAHAWALRRLETRYPPGEVALLNHTSLQILELLIRDHMEAIEQQVNFESSLMSVVLPAVAVRALPGPPAPACSGAGWRGSSARIFSCLRRMQAGTVALLAGWAGETSDPAEISRDVETALESMRAQLPNVRRQVNGDFLLSSGKAEK